MKFSLISHCNGKNDVPSDAIKEVSDSIQSLKIRDRKAASRIIREELEASLHRLGWSSEVTVSSASDMTITSSKRNVGLCLQTGNMARLYADMMKLQAMYVSGAINFAIMIVPSLPLAKELGSNIAHADRLERELPIFKKVFYTPTLVFSLE
jgi:hypothetical protein